MSDNSEQPGNIDSSDRSKPRTWQASLMSHVVGVMSRYYDSPTLLDVRMLISFVSVSSVTALRCTRTAF